MWTWKDWLDRRFMTRFTNLPEMEAEPIGTSDLARLASPDVVRELSTAAMRCGGCGSKVSATVLDRVLTCLTPFHRDEVVIGLRDLDDASVEHVTGRCLGGAYGRRVPRDRRGSVRVRADYGDPLSRRRLRDGRRPRERRWRSSRFRSPPEGKMEELLRELLTGAVEVLNRAETTLVGGHTTEGRELALGFALSGVIDPAHVLRKSGMQPGHQLILTKPIGSGTIFAAHMRLKAKGPWVTGAVASMVQSSRAAAASLRRHRASACTDVTGFGLVGHLVEMTRASAVDARLRLASVPLLDGARETIADGFLSSLHPKNARLRRAVANIAQAALAPSYPVVYDPQTVGGLLASVPSECAKACLDELHDLGYAGAAIIGSVEPRSGRDAPIWIDV